MRFAVLLAVLLIGCKPSGVVAPVPGASPKAVETAATTTMARVTRFVFGQPAHGFPLANTNDIEVVIADARETLLKRKLADDEALWGFGQRYDSLNMRGRTMESWIVDAWGGGSRSYVCAPYFISSAGYGLFVNCSGKVVFDCGATEKNELRITVPEAGTDVFVFQGTPREIVAAYTRLVGRPEPMPDWVFEPWISRNSYLSAYDVDRAVEGMETHGLKASAVVLEAWAESLQNFRFSARYPDPKAWIEKLGRQGYRVVCWETPSIWDSASTYREAKTNGWLVLKPDGSELRIDWLENAVKIDFRKPAAREWWQKMHEPLVAMGVAGFKTDGGERMPDEWFHNLHPFYYQRAVLEAFAAQGKQGMTFARSATPPCAGNATFWGGDQGCSWNDFPRVTRAGLSAALSGYFYWGHDAGGYAGTPTKELYIRWLQLGALSPIFQLHGTTPREPWIYDDETVRIAKYYFDLRWRLMPVILAAAKEAREAGVPMWRPLLWEFPDDRATWNLDDEFLLGNDLLVAPILAEFGERNVYLPAGEWVDVWTKTKHTGPKSLTVHPALSELPVYARNGAEKFFTALPVETPALALAGEKDERGIVPTQRIWRGQKYEKIFLTVPDGGPVTLSLPTGFELLPNPTQKGERVAFYVMWPADCPVGTYPVTATAASGSVTVELVKLPDWKISPQANGYIDLGRQSEVTAAFNSVGGAARFWLGSGDGITVWLNGEQVFEKLVHRSAVCDEDFVDVELKPGENTVRVKVTHLPSAIGPNGFYFRVETGLK